MAELIDKGLLMEELHSMLEGDADLRKDYEYMGIDDYIRSMPTTTEKEIRAKAITEFAEKLKRHITLDGSCNTLDWSSLSIVSMIGDIAKEMKGE